MLIYKALNGADGETRTISGGFKRVLEKSNYLISLALPFFCSPRFSHFFRVMGQRMGQKPQKNMVNKKAGKIKTALLKIELFLISIMTAVSRKLTKNDENTNPYLGFLYPRNDTQHKSRGAKIFYFVALILLLLFFCSFSRADSVYIGGYTAHFKSYPYVQPKPGAIRCDAPEFKNQPIHKYVTCDLTPLPEYNENNRLFAYEKWGYGVGYIKNSFNDDSWFIQKKFSLERAGNFEFNLNAGFIYGYRGCDYKNLGSKGACPSVSLEIDYTQFSFQPVFIITGQSATISTRFVF